MGQPDAYDDNGMKIRATHPCKRCGSRMVFDNEWRCLNCEMSAAADRREAANDAYRHRVMEEAQAFKRNGP
jgi:ribosomal protein L37E